ncbi:hypothetical protein Tco_0392922 [Tanacetum coccineum]
MCSLYTLLGEELSLQGHQLKPRSGRHLGNAERYRCPPDLRHALHHALGNRLLRICSLMLDLFAKQIDASELPVVSLNFGHHLSEEILDSCLDSGPGSTVCISRFNCSVSFKNPKVCRFQVFMTPVGYAVESDPVLVFLHLGSGSGPARPHVAFSSVDPAWSYV